MAIQPTQPQGIGGVLDTTFQLYKTSLAQVWPLSLLLAAVGSPPSIYLMMHGGGVASGDTAAALAMLGLMSSPVYWLINLVTIAATWWVVGALYLKQQAIGTDQELSTGSALQASVGRIVTLFLMSLLLGLALIFGMILLVVPFFILLVSLMLSTGLVMFEGKGPYESLVASHKLVWGNWWRTAVILTVGGILMFVIYMALALVIGLITPFIGLGTGDVMMSTLVSTLLISVLLNVVGIPFFSAMLIAVYWDLKLRKEGGDLAARVGALNAA
jgi:hypothetical protein